MAKIPDDVDRMAYIMARLLSRTRLFVIVATVLVFALVAYAIVWSLKPR